MVVVTTGTNKCATKRAAHGSHQYGRERSHHCGRGNHHSVMLSFAKILMRMIWDDHWDDVGMRHWDDDWEGDDWGDHWDEMMMMMMNRMITVIGMMMMMMMMMLMMVMVMMMVIVVVMVMVMG